MRVDANDVISAMTRCDLVRGFDLSPQTLASVPSTLLLCALARCGAGRASSGCLGQVARGLEIVARAPSEPAHHPWKVIELDRERLDPRARERWRVALSRRPLVSHRAWRLEIEILVFALLLWSAPYVVTFSPWSAELAWGVDAVRALSAGVWLLLLRSALVARRRPAWPEGRFLYPWGYVEIERDVMRVVPIDALKISVRGRRFPLDSVRLTMTEGDATKSLRVTADELPALLEATEEGTDTALDRTTLGYREAPLPIEGPRAAWPLAAWRRELGWAALAAMVGVGMPHLLGVDVVRPSRIAAPVVTASFRNEEGLRPAYASLLAWRTDAFHVVTDLGGCSASPTVTRSVESYLEQALETPRLAPARPVSWVAPLTATTQIRARCTWIVDPTQGTFAHADAQWNLQHHAEPLLRRHVSVSVDDVLSAMSSCGAERLDVSPRALAEASGALLRALIATDAFIDPVRAMAGHGDTPEIATCMTRFAPRLHVVAER